MLSRTTEVLQCDVSARTVRSDDKLKQHELTVVCGHETFHERKQPSFVRLEVAYARLLETRGHNGRSSDFGKRYCQISANCIGAVAAQRPCVTETIDEGIHVVGDKQAFGVDTKRGKRCTLGLNMVDLHLRFNVDVTGDLRQEGAERPDAARRPG
jgi:hypothetical protein